MSSGAQPVFYALTLNGVAGQIPVSAWRYPHLTPQPVRSLLRANLGFTGGMHARLAPLAFSSRAAILAPGAPRDGEE